MCTHRLRVGGAPTIMMSVMDLDFSKETGATLNNKSSATHHDTRYGSSYYREPIPQLMAQEYAIV